MDRRFSPLIVAHIRPALASGERRVGRGRGPNKPSFSPNTLRCSSLSCRQLRVRVALLAFSSPLSQRHFIHSFTAFFDVCSLAPSKRSPSMRFATIVLLALAAAPIVVSAGGTLGFALGDKKTDGTCKSTADYEADFDALGGSSKLVRTYSSSECNTTRQILPAAASKGFKVVLAVW